VSASRASTRARAADGGAGRGAKAAAIAAGWGPTAGRVLLGLVLAWFGYHELVQPSLWTGYVPAVSSASNAAVILVLAHGWLLLMLAVALIAGISVRAAAGIAALLLAQIVIWLTVTAGLSDLTLRDVGVLGLALCMTGSTEQRFILAR
jgi:hypothetical protein